MSAERGLRFVVAEPFLAKALDRLKQFGSVLELTDSSPQSLLNAITDADALLIRARTHVTARILEAAPRLKVIGRAASSCDHIDLRVARQRQIGVVYAPTAATRSLVEYTVGLILAAQRRLIDYDRRIRSGEFASLRAPVSRELGRMTVGLLGMGLVAESVGKLLATGFGSRVVYADPTGGRPVELAAEEVSVEQLLRESGVVSMHLPLRASTKQFLNATRIAMLSPEAVVVNTTRGGLIDTIALADALKSGRLAGAALDVFETEPLPMNHPIRNAPRCLLTPHVGCVTKDSDEAVFDVVDDVLRVLQGELPLHPAPYEAEAETPATAGV